jgi:hypothetical protein
MAVKRFCLVPHFWTLEDYARHTCFDHSHSHLSRAQLYDHDKHGSIEWIAIRYSDRELVPVTDKPDPTRRSSGGVVRISRIFPARGLSSNLGENLAAAVMNGESWALAMFAQMSRRNERQREND